MAAVHHLGFVVCLRTTNEEHFVVFIAVQNLVVIDAGCSSFDNMHVFRFREFGLKTPIHAPKIVFFWILPHKWGAM